MVEGFHHGIKSNENDLKLAHTCQGNYIFEIESEPSASYTYTRSTKT